MEKEKNVSLSVMAEKIELGLNTFRFCPRCGGNFVRHSAKSNRCSKCNFVLFQNPSAAVAAFIRDAQGRLLLCERAKEPAKGMLDLPGGFADAYECAEEALRRELREELGVEVDKLRYLFSLPNVYRYSELDIPTLDLFFECSIVGDECLRVADDVCAARFVPLSEVRVEQIGLSSIRNAVARYMESEDR